MMPWSCLWLVSLTCVLIVSWMCFALFRALKLMMIRLCVETVLIASLTCVLIVSWARLDCGLPCVVLCILWWLDCVLIGSWCVLLCVALRNISCLDFSWLHLDVFCFLQCLCFECVFIVSCFVSYFVTHIVLSVPRSCLDCVLLCVVLCNLWCLDSV